MSVQQIDDPDPTEVYDCATRFTVPSETRPHETHMVELADYDANGSCSCEHFKIRLEPLLSRRISPQNAIAQGAVTLKKNQHPDDALRCKHIIEAYRQIGPICVRAITNAKKLTTQKEKTDPPPF